MPTPCIHCPFSRDYEARYHSERVVVFIAEVLSDGGQACHMRPDDQDCVGARMFIEGGHPDVFSSVVEMAAARGSDSLAQEFFGEIERLMEFGDPDYPGEALDVP